MRGKLITFEGCEGVGKSTQVRLLKEYLVKTRQEAVFIREPGGTRISEKIRDIILSIENKEMSGKCELLLYNASRAQLISEVVKPALDEGKLVVCDRFIDSTLAYQGYARGLGFEYVKTLNEFVAKDCFPDATVYLDLNPKDAFRRKGGADKGDRLESEALSFHNRVYEGYKRASEIYSDRFVVIKPLGNKFATHEEIISALRNKGLIE